MALLSALTLACSEDSLVCHRASSPIVVDGRLQEPAWEEASKVSLKGPGLPAHVRLLWDETYWYLAFAVEDTDVWATSLKELPEVLSGDCVGVLVEGIAVYLSPMNVVADFKVHEGRRLFGWNLPGFLSATEISGTLNFPDRDSVWTAEIALPWAELGGPPELGEVKKVRLIRMDDGKKQVWPSKDQFGKVVWG
ncbi:MAG TPA: hypothetical protein EYP17_05795 [Candidatus Latescibacteria bacterium]|nr:hypothetical protein [Candidatus Latescibacterota bacterium]